MPSPTSPLIKQFDLSGRTALVTGGGGDIGGVAVRAFLEQGASVVIFDQSEGRMSAALDQFHSYGDAITGVVGDITSSPDLDRLFECGKFVNGIDILVNAAAIQSRQPYDQFELESLDALWGVNTRGLVDLTQRAVRVMEKKGSGAIINLCSVASLIGVRNKLGYSITKGAVGLFTRTLALEVAQKGIRVNGIAPGTIVTQFNREWLENNDEIRNGDLKKIPMNRFGAADELAGTFLLLASDAGSYISGELIVIDGGRLAGG